MQLELNLNWVRNEDLFLNFILHFEFDCNCVTNSCFKNVSVFVSSGELMAPILLTETWKGAIFV